MNIPGLYQVPKSRKSRWKKIKLQKFENLRIVGTAFCPLLEYTIMKNHQDLTDHPGENPWSLSSLKTKKKFLKMKIYN